MYSAAGDSLPESGSWLELGRFKAQLDNWQKKSFRAPSSGANARFAIRYAVVDGGPLGNNSDFIGIDGLTIESSGVDTSVTVNSNDWPIGDIPLNPGNMAPKATISNYGLTNITTPFPITYQISGPVNYTSTKYDTIGAGSTKTITFDNTFNPTDTGVYTAKIFIGGVGRGDSLECPFVVRSAFSTVYATLVPDGGCCFKINLFSAYSNYYDAVKITPAVPTTVISVNPVNSTTLPAVIPPAVPSVIWKSLAGTTFLQGTSYIGRICFSNTSGSFPVSIQYSTDHGVTFVSSDTVNVTCANFIPVCTDFDNRSTGTWLGNNTSLTVVTSGPTGTPTDYFLKVNDLPYGSFIYASAPYAGNWLNSFIGKSLSWDYRLFNDGDPNASNAIAPRIAILQGFNPNSPFVWGTNPVRGAVFVSNSTTTESGGWVNSRAPIELCALGLLPQSNQGTWQTYPINNSCTEWNLLLGNVTHVYFPVDLTSYQTELMGWDNICIKEFANPCICSNGILQNWNFTQNIVSGELGTTGAAPPWVTATWTPNIVTTSGCCDTGFVRFWGKRNAGERISQSGLNIQKNKLYQISICTRLSPSIVVPYGKIGVIFSGAPVTSYSATNNYNGRIIGGAVVGQGLGANTVPPIGPGGITSTNWATYTYNWVATGNFNTINLNPINDINDNQATVSWMDIDNICIKDMGYPTVGVPVNLNIKLQAMYPINDFHFVELRGSVSPYPVLDIDTVLSETVGSKSNLNLFFDNTVSGNSYYFVIKHRNSIETWSANPVTIIGDTTSYDFTTSVNKAYGSNMILVDGVASIYSGDVTQDGLIDASDASLVDNDGSNFVTGYVITDVTGDELVDASDASIIDNNGYNFVTVIRP